MNHRCLFKRFNRVQIFTSKCIIRFYLIKAGQGTVSLSLRHFAKKKQNKTKLMYNFLTREYFSRLNDNVVYLFKNNFQTSDFLLLKKP